MNKCCIESFKEAFQQVLDLLESEKNINREGLVYSLKYTISMLEKNKKVEDF